MPPDRGPYVECRNSSTWGAQYSYHCHIRRAPGPIAGAGLPGVMLVLVAALPGCPGSGGTPQPHDQNIRSKFLRERREAIFCRRRCAVHEF